MSDPSTLTIPPAPHVEASPSEKLTLDPLVYYDPCWLSWVGSVTPCLRALGIACDPADVAGHSGYAFQLTIEHKLCPSGPTVFPIEPLIRGVWRVGRSTALYMAPECHTGEWINDRTRAHCREALNLVKREINAQRPCVLWGAYIPEFAIAVGYDNNSFIVQTLRRCQNQPHPPIKFDELNAPGGAYVLAFPTAMSPHPEIAARDSIEDAIKLLRRNERSGNYAFGLAAYDLWIDALKSNRADPFGNSYNAQCWAEARKLAHQFIERIAERYQKPRAQLIEAASALGTVSDALGTVAKLFPFTLDKTPISKDKRDAAIDALQQAQRAEPQATEALIAALEVWPRAQRLPG